MRKSFHKEKLQLHYKFEENYLKKCAETLVK